jgi:hypothetical protein
MIDAAVEEAAAKIMSTLLVLLVKVNANMMYNLKMKLIMAAMVLGMTKEEEMDVAWVMEHMGQVAVDY